MEQRIRLALKTFRGLGLARIPLATSDKPNLGCMCNSLIFLEPAFLVTRRWKICNCSQLILLSGDETSIFAVATHRTHFPYVVCYAETTTAYSVCQGLFEKKPRRNCYALFYMELSGATKLLF